jgi:hypothetical protein
MKANPLKKADTSKNNGNTCWWRTNERKDPNAIDVDALTMEERATLLRQEKCFCCKKTGHMELPTETGGIIKTEEGRSSKICLHHDQSAHKGAEREFYKDGHGGQE